MIFSLPELDYQPDCFRGTDDSVIGWKEDFQLTYSGKFHLTSTQLLPFCLSTCQTLVAISLFLDIPRVVILPSMRLSKAQLLT